MEVNKIVAGCCATLLVFLGLNFFAELVYHPHGGEELAYALAVEESGDGEADEEPQIDLAAVFSEADPAAGEGVFRKCASCHKVEDGANAVGPYLYGVVGRQVASVEGFNYSGALPADEEWTPEHLFNFLKNPQEYASGTSMGFAGLSDPADRADVIAYLNQDDGSPMDLVAAVSSGEGAEGGAEGEASSGEAASGDETSADEPAGDETAESEDAAESDASSGSDSTDGAASSDGDESDGGSAESGQAGGDESAQTSEDGAPAGEGSGGEAGGGSGGGGELAAAFAAADPSAGEKVFRKCSVCHKLEEGQNGVGPSLYGVVGRDIASLGDYNYSDALPADKTWTPENMFTYLKDPRDWAPGTKMTFRGLDDPQDRANVISYINEADGSPEALPGQ